MDFTIGLHMESAAAFVVQLNSSPANELLQFDKRLIIWKLPWWVLAESRGGSVDRARHPAVQRHSRAADEVDRHARAIRRIFDRQAKLEVHRHASEQLPLHPQEADLVVV